MPAVLAHRLFFLPRKGVKDVGRACRRPEIYFSHQVGLPLYLSEAGEPTGVFIDIFCSAVIVLMYFHVIPLCAAVTLTLWHWIVLCFGSRRRLSIKSNGF